MANLTGLIMFSDAVHQATQTRRRANPRLLKHECLIRLRYGSAERATRAAVGAARIFAAPAGVPVSSDNDP